MATKSSIAISQQESLRVIREVIKKHNPDAPLREPADGQSLPSSVKRNDDFGAYLAEAVAQLAILQDRQLTRRGPGRPRKNAQ
jgi:hypothetical protein